MVAEFRLLGDFEVYVADRVVDAGHDRQQCVLAVLLIEANRVVSAAELIDRVWGEQRLPAHPRNALQTYISLLRRALAMAGGVSIDRQSPGYKLTVDAGVIDMHRFGELIGQAQGSDDARAVALLDQALGLWRGVPFANLDTPWINSVRSMLAAQRHAAQLDLADAQLRLGQHVAAAAGLSGQVAAYPFDERLAGQYMTALYRSGRQVDALSHYRHVRQRLVAELGAEPGSALRSLHEQILRSDPALSERPSPQRISPLVVPRQLPVDVAGFTGRDQYLAELDLLLPSAPSGSADGKKAKGGPTAAAISAVSGTAGVGKTTLAVHWAYRVAERFPDGQLYVNLRGYDLERPVTASEALGGFLRALGVADQDIPADTAERAARFRSLLAGRRMLVLVDNADEAEQVRPLLPGNPACVTLVTSRSSLTGLVARDGAVRLDLDLLPAGEAADLLRVLIGPRADAEPAVVAVLGEQCARLPLALRIAAELARARPAVPLADLVAELADEQRRLDLLEAGGDPRAGMRTVFSWSCRQLDAGTLRMFRLAGLHPGPDVDAYEAAALADTTVHLAGQALDRLARVNLMHSVTPGRYGMHDLLRAYARELAARGSESEQHKAFTHLLGYHLDAAATAMDTLFPAEHGQRPSVPRSMTPTPPLTAPDRARDWLDANRASLIAAAGHAVARGFLAHVNLLTATIFRYLDHGGHYAESAALHTRAYQAARHAGDRVAEANALTGLGVVDFHQGRYHEAVGRLEHALSLAREAGDRPSEARSLCNLGIANYYLARYEESIRQLRESVAFFREQGNRTAEARNLGNLATVEARLGRYEPAVAHLDQALVLHREADNRPGEAYVLANLGSLCRDQGQYARAADFQQHALVLFRAEGSRRSEARALAEFGDVCRLRGDYQQAADCQQQALTLSRQIGDRGGEAEALNGLGEVLLATMDSAGSRAHHFEALTVASQTGDKHGQARAHEGIGYACQADGDLTQGQHHWREALALYAAIGAPEADRVRAQLRPDTPASAQNGQDCRA